MPQTEEKARLLEFAALQAANETDNPVLAHLLNKYRTQNKLSIDQLVFWLGLQNKDEFYRLSLCLKPSYIGSPLDWRDYLFGLKNRFPTLNVKRLRLVMETTTELEVKLK